MNDKTQKLSREAIEKRRVARKAKVRRNQSRNNTQREEASYEVKAAWTLFSKANHD